MNIFVLDKNPELAVKYLCDAHVVKMTLETCQLLCTQEYAINEAKGKDVVRPVALDWPELYEPAYMNHPCRLCLDNHANYNWLTYYFSCICKEYRHRYNKMHKCELFSHTWFNLHCSWRDCELTFPKCMPEEFQVGGDDIDSVVASYRNYYKFKKENLSRFYYKNRTEPKWLS